MDRSLLSRATDGSDAPTPGYLYNDIAKNAASSPVACSEIATYLTRRLSSKNNPNIKYKCLKVLAKVSVDPMTRGQLKRAVSQDASAVGAIKEALQFRGPQDAARGDLLNERVRTAAKEALDAIYSDTPVEQTSNSTRIPSSSYGASPHSHVQPGPPVSTGRMQGIGNPMYADPRLDAQKGIANMTLGEVVGSAGETIVAMVKDPLARNLDLPPPRGHSGGGYGGGGGVSEMLDCCLNINVVGVTHIIIHPQLLHSHSIQVLLRDAVSWHRLPMDNGPWHPIVVQMPFLLHQTLIPNEMRLISRLVMVVPKPFRGHNKIVLVSMEEWEVRGVVLLLRLVLHLKQDNLPMEVHLLLLLL